MNSGGVPIASGLLCCCVAIALIIAIPIQTAGYQTHLAKNEALVDTTCTVKEQTIVATTCYRSCNCYSVCSPQCVTRNINGKLTQMCNQSCMQHCSTCPYTCYDAMWAVQYSTRDQFGQVEMLLTTMLPCGTHYASTVMAQQALNARSLNQTFACFYDSNDIAAVRTSKYDVIGFYASFIVFYILACVGALFVVILLIVYWCTRITS